MAGRIVVFGATGYTGELTARGSWSVVRCRCLPVVTPTVWLDWPLSSVAWNRRLLMSTVPARCARWSSAVTCW